MDNKSELGPDRRSSADRRNDDAKTSGYHIGPELRYELLVRRGQAWAKPPRLSKAC